MNVVTPERGIRENDDWNVPGPGNKLSNENVPSGPRARGGADCRCGERERMVLWPAVSLIGFLVLTALVIAMGTRSTARYEREREAAVLASGRPSAAEPVGVAGT